MSPIQRVVFYVRQVRGRYALGAAVTLAYAACFQLPPLLVRELVGRIDDGASREAVTEGALWLLAAALLVAAFRAATRIVLFGAARQIEYRIRDDFFSHLQRLPQSFFNQHRTGDLMSRAVNDITSLRLFLGMGLMNILQTPALYVGAIAVMATIDWTLTLLVVLPYPLFIGIGRIFGRRLHAANLAVQEQLGELSTSVQENASGVLVVRSYGLEDQESRRFDEANTRLYRRQLRLARVNASLPPVVGLLPALAMVFVLFVGGARVSSGQMATRDLWAFYTYIFQLTFPTILMGWVIAIVQRGLAALQRLGEILDTVPSIRDRADVLAVASIRGDVELRGLSFSYSADERGAVLTDVDLEITAGQTLGIVGPVGAGKSTLVSLVPRLLEVPEGTVFIDGIDVNRIPLASLRASIAMVPQDSFLFSSTVAENIRFGRPDATLDEVREAARRAHVLEDIEDFSHGFDTPVGERGITLSGGQRQRIALARALMLEPALLILDDSLSSVDTATEEAILKELRTARAGRTCLIVAHRLSAVRDADQLIVIGDDGRIAERGTHASLLELDGFYARLHRQQQLEAELDAEDVA